MRVVFPFIHVPLDTALFLRMQIIDALHTATCLGKKATTKGLARSFHDVVMLAALSSQVAQPLTFSPFYYPCRHCVGNTLLKHTCECGISDDDPETNQRKQHGLIKVNRGFEFFGICGIEPHRSVDDDLSTTITKKKNNVLVHYECLQMTLSEKIMWTTPTWKHVYNRHRFGVITVRDMVVDYDLGTVVPFRPFRKMVAAESNNRVLFFFFIVLFFSFLIFFSFL